jgi:AraC-like DNA-binding protein
MYMLFTTIFMSMFMDQIHCPLMPDNNIIHNDLLSIIILLGVIQAIFLTFIFLWNNKKNPSSNIYLGIILFLIAIQNLDFWASYSRYTLKFPFLLDISVPFTFAMGPLFYHYIFRSLKNSTDRYLLLHYIPFAFFFAYSFFFMLQPNDFKYNVFVSSRNIGLPLKEVILPHAFDPLGIRNRTGLINSIQLCIYLVLSYSIFIKHVKISNIYFFKTGDPVITWLRNLLLSITMIVITAIIIQLVFPGGRVEFMLATCFTLFIYYLSFNLIRGSDFLNQTLFPEKYKKSSMTDQMKNDYRTKIEHLMTEDKLFLDNLFSITRLSRLSGIPQNQLSQLLNESFHQTFFEFTRYYRIKEARKLLSSPNNSEINIEEIAYMVGYNSKSAFNKAFLNITGQTPLSFKKKSIR